MSSTRLRKLIKQNPDVAVHCFKLLIAHNVLMSLYRRYIQPALESESARGRGFGSDKRVFYLQSVGVMKEALDAFSQVNKCRSFIGRELTNNMEFKKRMALLERVSDRKNPSSFYNRHLKPVRDRAAFHWNGVSAYLEDLVQKPDQEWPQMYDVPNNTPKSWEVIFPIADDFLSCYVPKDVSANFREMSQILDALSFYAQSIVSIEFR